MSPTIVGRAEAPAAPAALQQGEGAEEGGHQQPKPHLATTHIGVKKEVAGCSKSHIGDRVPSWVVQWQ